LSALSTFGTPYPHSFPKAGDCCREELAVVAEDHTRFVTGQLLIVADGLGGHKAGEKASGIAVKTVVHYVLSVMPWLFRLNGEGDDDLKGELKGALERSQSAIRASAAADSRCTSMGTTLTMAYILWPRLYVVHVGDSRCYVLRQSKLEQITRDHTVGQQLVEAGVFQPEENSGPPMSNVLWNALGGKSDDVFPEVYKA
jgi:protein phosphatase